VTIAVINALAGLVLFGIGKLFVEVGWSSVDDQMLAIVAALAFTVPTGGVIVARFMRSVQNR
jgi:hypothetical protein